MRATLFTSSIALGVIAQLAQAQTLPPPAHVPVDSNGVDLARGTFNIDQAPQLTNPFDKWLNFRRFFVGASNGWGTSTDYYISVTGFTYTIVLGGSSFRFLLSGSAYVDNDGSGASLSYNSSTAKYLLDLSDGTRIEFDTASFGGSSAYQGAVARATKIIQPDGQTADLSYDISTSGSVYARLRAITSSSGGGLRLSYVSNVANNAGTLQDWTTISSAPSYNMAVDNCLFTDASCTFTQPWPKLTYTRSLS